MHCFVSLFLLVSTSAVNYLESLVSEMTYYVLSVLLNPMHSLTCAVEVHNVSVGSSSLVVLSCASNVPPALR